MSTDLYGVRVLDVAPAERRVRFTIFVVYYDVHGGYHQPLPDDRSFFFRILWDKADTRFGKGGPLGAEVTVNHILDESFVDRNAYRYVERFERLATRNEPWNPEGFSDFYYGDGEWQDEDKLVQADYDVFVTDAKYIEHLKPKMGWGTTSYQTHADGLTLEEAPTLPDLSRSCLTLRPFAGKATEAGTAEDVRFSPDGKHLAVASQSGELVVYRFEDQAEVLRAGLEGNDLFPRLGWLDAETVWLAGQKSGTQWNIPTGDAKPFEAVGSYSKASPTTRYWISDLEANPLPLTDTHGELVREIAYEGIEPGAVAFSADETHLLLADSSSLRRIDIATGEQTLLPVQGHLMDLAVAPDESSLAFWGSGALNIVSIDGRPVRHLSSDGYPTRPTWSPDGRFFVVAWAEQSGYGCRLRVYRVGDAWDPFDMGEPLELDPERATSPASADDLMKIAHTLHQTVEDFGRGWDSHVSDNMFECAQAVARAGGSRDLQDYIEEIPQPSSRIQAKAMAAFHLAESDRDRAHGYLTSAIELYEAQPEDQLPWIAPQIEPAIGLAQCALGQRTDGEKRIERAWEMTEDKSTRAAFKMAWLWYLAGASQRADAVIRDVEISWAEDEIHRYIALLVSRKDYDRARAVVERLHEAGEVRQELVEGLAQELSAHGEHARFFEWLPLFDRVWVDEQPVLAAWGEGARSLLEERVAAGPNAKAAALLARIDAEAASAHLDEILEHSGELEASDTALLAEALVRCDRAEQAVALAEAAAEPVQAAGWYAGLIAGAADAAAAAEGLTNARSKVGTNLEAAGVVLSAATASAYAKSLEPAIDDWFVELTSGLEPGLASEEHFLELVRMATRAGELRWAHTALSHVRVAARQEVASELAAACAKRGYLTAACNLVKSLPSTDMNSTAPRAAMAILRIAAQ